jgi:hypothetical protein|tara:strand:- start:16161 stop:16361 length:201 start_codon:yes stop_codon:yes gene_type:complete
MKNFMQIFPVLKQILEKLFNWSGLFLLLLMLYIFTFESDTLNEIPTNDMIFLATLIIISQINDKLN